MKVAIVHDYLNQYGGAERVLEEFLEIWPTATVFTSIFDPKKMPEKYKSWNIVTSWLDRLPFIRKRHQMFMPLYPHAFESFDFSEFDLVISSSSGFAHGILTGPQTLNICYSHSPPRFLWSYHEYVMRERLGKLAQLAISPFIPRLRVWDRVAADRTDHWISTSRVVQRRLQGYYGKDSVIIPPPVNTGNFTVGEGRGDYFLLLMRLVGWKVPQIVVDACTLLNLPLVVAGDGREFDNLKHRAGPTVRFVGRVNDEEMRPLYRDAKALILPSEEDFGITPLEAMASGRPVIAFRRGGALDTIREGVTGIFFDEQTVPSLGEALDRFETMAFNPATIRRHVERFDSVQFRTDLLAFVEQHMESFTAAQLAAQQPARFDWLDEPPVQLYA
jgi:glycosyltransferase involved in cell wall biosynthesis